MKTRTEAWGMGLEGLRGRGGKVTCCGQVKDGKTSIGLHVQVKICITC